PRALSIESTTLVAPGVMSRPCSIAPIMATQRITSSRVSTLGRKMPASPPMPMIASRSSLARLLSSPFTRTQTRLPGNFGAYARTPARASAFSAAGTESSRSKMKASAGSPIAFSRNFSRLAGTRRKLRASGMVLRSSRVFPLSLLRGLHRSLRRRQARHPSRHQIPDRGRRIAERREHLLGVLAQHGCMPVDRGPVVIEENGIAGGAHLAQTRMLEVLHHASGDDLGIVEHLLEVVHARARHAGNEQRLLQFLAATPAHG